MPNTQYLQRRHHTWYVVVEVPKRLRGAVGRPRLIRSLRTHSLEEANTLKHAVVAEFKRRLRVVSQAPNSVEAKAIAKALEYRRQFLAADPEETADLETGQSFSEREFVVDDIRYDAFALQDKAGPGLANRFIRLATGQITPLGELPEQWLNELQGQIAEQTRSQHRATIKGFIRWAGEEIVIEEVTRRKAGDYIGQHLLPSGLSRKTIKRQVSSLSSLWRWLKSRGLAQDNPWRDHELGAAKRTRERRGFTDEQLKLLLVGSYQGRYRTILYDLVRLALVTGARLEELCALRTDDVEEREDGFWLTIRKGKTDAAARSIPVHPSAINILQRRLGEGGPFLINGLKPGGPDEKRSWYVSKVFGRFRAQVGIAGALQDFHALRNTFIEAMEGAEVPEPTVKLLVGHKRVSLTFGRYSKGERVALRKATKRLSYAAEVMKLIRQDPPRGCEASRLPEAAA
jgi:integrase